MDVVILAAGASRRFGQAKQFTPVAPDGATLLEITARYARDAGCKRAVIVTAPDRDNDVTELFATRPVEGLEVATVIQHLDDVPAPVTVTRNRPWGTAHALWATRNVVTDPFLLFNADDYYGPNAPATLIAELEPNGLRPRFALLGYPLGSTLSPEGNVSRAVCEVDTGDRLVSLHEYTAIDGEGRVVSGVDKSRVLPLDALVSMNAWAFTPAVFPILGAFLRSFLASADAERGECYLPEVVATAARAGAVEIRVAAAPDRWCGITWPGDHKRVTRQLSEQATLQWAIESFGLETTGTTPEPFGEGLINKTWRVDTLQGSHLLQQLNSRVFPDPVEVVRNGAAAAVRLDNALHQQGDSDARHRLVYRNGPDGVPWLSDQDGEIWRAAIRVPDSRSADPTRPKELRAAAYAMGQLPGLLAAGTGPEITEILPGFHDTGARMTALRAAANADACNRLNQCNAEYDRLIELAPLADRVAGADQPVRLVHNDAKLDNVLVDVDTGESLCVIDLDTVMPGFAVHDFGDLVRSAVTGCPEDEPDLKRITVRESMFRDLAEGYLEGAAGWISEQERLHLIDGTIVITFEQAVRFLADYLDGDSYFPVEDDHHNLRRARAQIRLLEQLLVAEKELQYYVNSIGKSRD